MMNERMQQLEYTMSDGVGKHAQQINDLMNSHSQFRDMYGAIEGRRQDRETDKAVLEERLKGLEILLGSTLHDSVKDLQQAKRDLQVLQGKLDAAQLANREAA